MKRVDATVPIGPETPVWPGDPRPKADLVSAIYRGDQCNLTALSMSAHTGTHVDAPLHFIKGGGTVDALDLDALIGPAYVHDLTQAPPTLEREHLAGIPDCQRLILRTSNTKRGLMNRPSFAEDYAHVGKSAASWIADSGISLLGIDYLSVEGFESGSHIVHDILLGAGVVVVEGLKLTDVDQGWWRIICLPLKLLGAEGAPARVIFSKDHQEHTEI